MTQTTHEPSSSAENSESNERAFIQEALDRGEPSGWFDEVYTRAEGNEGAVPWAHLAPRPAFAHWLEENDVQGNGRTALVIACGLGDDAEALADRGFKVTAFDIAPTAIKWAKQRFPDSSVDYSVADMFEPPAEWINRFDFVLEIFTVQALPIDIRPKAAKAVVQFVADNGELLVITMGTNDSENRPGPPWPLIREELDLFLDCGLREVQHDELTSASERAPYQWRTLYQRID